jgi:dihydropteroate synthase
MSNYTFCSRHRLWQILPDEPIVMAILNLTPDSFFAESRITNADGLLQRAEKMLEQGAKILDIGAVSTRPDATQVTEEEELKRLIEPLRRLRLAFPDALISVDTFRARVAEEAAEIGADIINDVTGGSEPNIWAVAARYRLPYILTHLQGELATMQNNPQYDNVVLEVSDYFSRKIQLLHANNLYDVIIDLGFGFGKTIAHNYTLLRDLPAFAIHDLPILVGVSRKSMIYRPLQITAADSLPATTALHLYALQNGANILRTHDIAEAQQAVALWRLLK